MTDKQRPKHRKLIITLATTSIIILTLSICVRVLFFSSITKQDSILYIPENTSLETLLDSLSAGNKITSTAKFSRTAKIIARDKTIQPGRYELSSGMSAISVVKKIYGRRQSPVKVTFNNIRTLPQLASLLGRRMMADSATFANTLLNDSIAASYGFTPQEFISMFIPDTYELYWTTEPEVFIQRINSAYTNFWNKERQAKLERVGLSQKEVSTLASIIEEETNKIDEMPIIAGTYLNRLRIGMRLQADPTVKFALEDFNIKRIKHNHLKVNSPYNTYKNKGLPPGPIRMASPTSIDAVLNYKKNNYIYFCARNDFSGYHVFAATYKEHIRNAQAYTSTLNRAGIK